MTKVRSWGNKYGKRVVVTVIGLITVVVCAMHWDNIRFWLEYFWIWSRKDGGGEGETNGVTLRNNALVVAAVVGLGLAIWRNATATRQADTAERGQNNERFQRAAEMLGNANLATRLGGISALSRLAQEHPKEYHIQIMDLIGAFVRHPTKDAELDGTEGTSSEKDSAGGTSRHPKCRPDVQEAVRRVIGGRTKEQHKVEQIEDYHTDLTGSNLIRANLIGTNLRRTDLRCADLSDAALFRADLTDADLTDANLTDAELTDAELNRARLIGANLTRADLSGAKKLTQDQIVLSCQDPDCKPPKLPKGLILGRRDGDRTVAQATRG